VSNAASSVKDAANKAAEWVKDAKDNLTSNQNVDKARDAVKSGADRAADKAKKNY